MVRGPANNIIASACLPTVGSSNRGLNYFFCAQYINIGTGGADMGSSYFPWRIVGWGHAAEMCMTGDRVSAQYAFNAALNATSLEDTSRMEDRNQAFFIVSGPLEGMEEATEVVNGKRRALLRLAELRRSDPPVISGKDALLISQIAFFDEPRRFANKVNELCNELEKRIKAGKGVADGGAARILVSGCLMAIPNRKVHHIVETSGAVIVMEELCTGSRYYENLVGEGARDLDALLDGIADRYLDIDCAVFTPNRVPIENIGRLARDYRADGVIYYSLVFCTPYSVEAYKVKRAVEEAGLPFLYVETDYGRGDTGQLSTRVGAFLEMVNKK